MFHSGFKSTQFILKTRSNLILKIKFFWKDIRNHVVTVHQWLLWFFKIILFICFMHICVCVSVRVRVCHGRYVKVWGLLEGIGSLSHCVGPRDWLEVLWLGSRHLFPPSRHTDPILSFKLNYFHACLLELSICNPQNWWLWERHVISLTFPSS